MMYVDSVCILCLRSQQVSSLSFLHKISSSDFFSPGHPPSDLVLSSFLHISQDLMEPAGHEIWPLLAAIVPLQVLQEAEEEGVHRHGVHREEGGGHRVAGQGGQEDRCQQVVEGRQVGEHLDDRGEGARMEMLHLWDVTMEDEVGDRSAEKDYQQLAKEQ